MSVRAAAWEAWPTPSRAEGLSAWHRGRCAMCGARDRLVRDHCHQTGLVRGLLCAPCNASEGAAARDDERWRAWRAWRNPARAHGWCEVYVGAHNRTPLSPTSDLLFMAMPEREDWWEMQALRAAHGEPWPVVELSPQALKRKAEAEDALDAIAAAVV